MSSSRLKSYTLTASGAAALAASGMASGDIQTSGATTSIAKGTQNILFSIDSANVWARHFGTGNISTSGYAAVSFSVESGSVGVVSSGATINDGFSGTGREISARVNFSNSNTQTPAFTLPLGSSQLLGLRQYGPDGWEFGWIEYSLSLFEGEFTFTVNRWAYNDVAGQGIIAGQNTAAGSSAVPGLGGLAALAIGAAGVRSRRQRTVA